MRVRDPSRGKGGMEHRAYCHEVLISQFCCVLLSEPHPDYLNLFSNSKVRKNSNGRGGVEVILWMKLDAMCGSQFGEGKVCTDVDKNS